MSKSWPGFSRQTSAWPPTPAPLQASNMPIGAAAGHASGIAARSRWRC